MRNVIAAAAALGASLAWSLHADAAPPPPYATKTLANGLQILVVERHSSPLMTVEIAVHNGAMTEPPDYNGLSHLYEHMFFKGNQALPDQLVYFARMRELGMLFNGTTDDERVNYFFTTTNDHYAEAMTFMRDAICTPLFDAKELDRERVVVTGELDRAESTPQFLRWRAMEKLVFWKYPSRHIALGDRKTVLATTPAKMRTIQQRYYVPNNAVLVVTGDVKSDDVFKNAEALYGDWKRAPDPFVKFPLPKDPPIAKSAVVIVTQPVQTFSASLEWQGPSTTGPTADDSYAMDILVWASAEPASKFQKALVDSGVCVRAWMGWLPRRNGGPISVDVEATPANVDACLKATMDELAKWKTAGYFSDEELKNAAYRIDVAQARQRETTENYAHQLTFAWAMANLDYYATYSDRLHAVTQDHVVTAVNTWMNKPFVLGALETPELAKTMDETHLATLVGITKGGAK